LVKVAIALYAVVALLGGRMRGWILALLGLATVLFDVIVRARMFGSSRPPASSSRSDRPSRNLVGILRTNWNMIIGRRSIDPGRPAPDHCG
jgi:hypothetical protein